MIHTVGVQPDIEVILTEEQEEARMIRARGMVEAAPEAIQERILDAKDPQLERAIEVLKGIQLFTRRLPDERADRIVAARQSDEATVR
jgi:hypothetical protein